MDGGLKIGEAARLAGVTVKAVRFYEQKGLLPPVKRSSSGYRLYSNQEVARLVFIRRATRVGLSLEEVREMLAFHDRSEQPCPHLRVALKRKVDELDQHIAMLTAFREHLMRLQEAAESIPYDARAICPVIAYGSERLQTPSQLPSKGRGHWRWPGIETHARVNLIAM